MRARHMSEPVCNRCGQCCYYMKNGKPTKCRFLIKLPSGNTLCRIYKKRVGTIISINDDGNKVMCVPRIIQIKKCPGCPYNKDEWKEKNENGKNN